MSNDESDLADDLAKAEEALQEFYKELRAIPWWHFRKTNEAARKYNNQLHLVNRMRWSRPRPMKTYTIVFMSGEQREVLGYTFDVSDAGVLRIQTSNRQGGPESYEYYPLVNIKRWSV